MRKNAIIIAILIIGIACLPINIIAIQQHATILQRLCYPFFHANILHAMINAWTFVTIVSKYNIKYSRNIAAYTIAIIFPIDTLNIWINIPQKIVGLSVIVFFLFATITMEVQRKIYYQAWMAVYLAMGFILPQVCGWIHLYAYMCGLIYALINRMIKCKGKSLIYWK